MSIDQIPSKFRHNRPSKITIAADIITMSKEKSISVNFEVFGRVQGVYFRKHTQQQAKLLGLRGYCMNTERGTVQGTLQGPVRSVNVMKKWLQEVGSPKSKIEKALFSGEEVIKSYTFGGEFLIRR